MGVCSCSVKYLLFIFNFIVVLCGLAMIAVGVMINSYGYSVKTLLSGHVTTTAAVIIGIGAIVFIIAFFGCCGAVRESSCMITTYGLLLLAILFIELAVGALAFVYRSQIQQELKEQLKHMFDDYSANQEAVDNIQKGFKCCGTDGPDSWVGNVPKSCCQQENNDDGECTRYRTGCLDKVSDVTRDWLQNLGGIAIGVACIEVFGVIFAFFLASSIRNQQMRGYV